MPRPKKTYSEIPTLEPRKPLLDITVDNDTILERVSFALRGTHIEKAYHLLIHTKSLDVQVDPKNEESPKWFTDIIHLLILALLGLVFIWGVQQIF